jgi:hypothetical protein
VHFLDHYPFQLLLSIKESFYIINDQFHTMKRFVSLDILRGLAIIIMLILHVIKKILDIDGLIADGMTIPLLNLLLVLILPLIGGLAGLFLMVSSIGNMVSMTKQLQSGRKSIEVIVRQVFGGILLLFFAMLIEGTIGYDGYLAEFVKKIGYYEFINNSIWRWRWSHMATIHTIAWGQILNGIVHGILAANDRWKNYKLMKQSYLIGAVVVLGLTAFFWWLARELYPGYPYAINPETGRPIMYIYLGKTSFKEGFILFLLNPLAGHPEPIFPFLASSFLGSIIGLYIMQEKSKITYKELKRLFSIGFFMIIIGLIGFLINMTVVIKTNTLAGLNSYINLWDFTYQTQDHGVPYAGWLFIYLLLAGIALILILSVFLIVELRGDSQKIAKRTRIIRRFGIFALTIYAIQGVFNLVHYLLTFWTEPYKDLRWGYTFVAIIMTLILLYLILVIWEKLHYIGTIEWILALLSIFLVPGKHFNGEGKMKKIFQDSLNLSQLLYNVEWIDLDPYILPVETSEHPSALNMNTIDEKCTQRDAKLGFVYSLGSIVFFPYLLFALYLVHSTRKRGYSNKLTILTLVISTIVILLLLTVLVLSSIFTLESLGVKAPIGF